METKRRPVKSLMGLMVLTMLLMFLPKQSAATDYYWVGGSGWWDNPNNWSFTLGGPGGAGQPERKIGEDRPQVYITQDDGVDRTVFYSNTLNPNESMNLTLDSTGGGTLIFSISKDQLFAREYIGYWGTAVLSQTGGRNGLHYAGSLYLGYETSGLGIYNLYEGLADFSRAYIGYSGTGIMNQTGGEFRLWDNLYLGYNETGVGTYNLYDGIINSVQMGIYGGRSGTATFNQSGGYNETFWRLTLGGESTGSGTYNMTGGHLYTNTDKRSNPYGCGTIVGEYGAGTFNQSGGEHIVDAARGSTSTGNNGLMLALHEGSIGTYNLSGGNLQVRNVEVVGVRDKGAFNQSAGEHLVLSSGIYPSEVTIARDSGSEGIFNLSGGTLTVDSIINNDTLNYSGGELHSSIVNNGKTTLSGSGIRTVNGGVVSNGEFKTMNTSAQFIGSFTNNSAFISDSSVNMFTDLIIGENGYMQGDWEDFWYVCGKLQGIKIEGDVVTNISGSEGMYIFYLPSVAENSYLGDSIYNLSGGGKLEPTSKCPELVEIDIKPGTYPNDINLTSKGVVPVAILTTADFDANSVVPGTVVFAGTKTPRWTRADVNNDGIIDLLLHFNTKDLNLTQKNIVALLTGQTLDGMDILGKDTVNIVP